MALYSKSLAIEGEDMLIFKFSNVPFFYLFSYFSALKLEWKRVSVSIKQHYTLECYPKLSHDFNRSLQMKLYVMRYVLPTNFNGERDFDVISIAFVKPTSLRS